jgi:fructose-1-phosphate kinase PfkB-like protein
MIVTMTANPSVDRTSCVDQLVRSDVMRGSRRTPSATQARCSPATTTSRYR